VIRRVGALEWCWGRVGVEHDVSTGEFEAERRRLTAVRIGCAKLEHPEQVAPRSGNRTRLAAQEHGTHFEVVVHLGGRLILDESRKLHGGRWR